ncbi:MAG TPA: type II toxin-antitoxin system HicB family antitoxin, partial [Gemmataceae bacterium]|nr:type II toxin-antitoxin system HicB family antitoxin [Gemmataceae bacterium]
KHEELHGNLRTRQTKLVRIATAKTQKQLERRIREAIEFHIEGLRLHGEPVPEPTIEAGMVSVAVPGTSDE